MSDIYSTIQPKSTFTPFQLKYWEDLISKRVTYRYIKLRVELADQLLPSTHRHYLGTKKRAEKVEVLEHFLAQMKTVSLLTGETIDMPDIVEIFNSAVYRKSVFDTLYKPLRGK